MKKKNLIIISSTLAALAITGGALAFLTDIASKTNILTIGGNTIEIVEDFEPPEIIEAGISFKKDVQVNYPPLQEKLRFSK